MITFMDSKEKLKEESECLDPQLWHACAGGMVQMPRVNSMVFYFPQGHAEHACEPINFRNYPKFPPFILCRVAAISYMADSETDEVYAKLGLVPLNFGDSDYEDDGVRCIHGSETQDKPSSFAKTLTQSDANNGGGFSVPRYCAETIFPRLDYSVEPPVQNILAKDVHGETWNFRHIYRGTPRRHLLTTGWSNFVNHKKLVAGDSIVFLRAQNGDLCVGIRRAKRGFGGGGTPGWNGDNAVPYEGFSGFSRNGNTNNSNVLCPSANFMGRGKVKSAAVIEAATLAANRKPFEVVYYPRASTPEFCVKASLFKAAMQIRWCAGMKFKMAFETEDSSRISWFMGTISSVQVADPLHWPDSPWRLLQVTWDEPDLLQNVQKVSPWLVELVSNIPSAIQFSPFSPPRKKMRLPQHHSDLIPLDGHIPLATTFPSNNPFGFFLPQSTIPAGMQGARHAHYGISLSDLHLNKLHSGLFQAVTPMRVSNDPMLQKPCISENLSCLLTMANSTQSLEKPNGVKTPHIVLFGRTILTEQQISNGSSDGDADKVTNVSHGYGYTLHQQGLTEQFSSDHRHCKVFMESEDVGRTMDLSLLRSYDELYMKLAQMFGIEKSEMLRHVLYHGKSGAVKHIGDEPFSHFSKTARRLTILMDSSSDKMEKGRARK